MFQLSAEEWDSLRLQIETSKRGGRENHPKYLHFSITKLNQTKTKYNIKANLNNCILVILAINYHIK